MLVNPNGLMSAVLTVRFRTNKQARIFSLEEHIRLGTSRQEVHMVKLNV